MLGTNDSKNYQWDESAFHADYLEMARNFQAMSSKPDLYVMIPPPLYQDNAWYMNQSVINDRFPELIPNIAKELNLADDHVIDIMSGMGGKELTSYQYFCDGQYCDACHPNDAGYSQLASEVYKAIFLQPLPGI